MNDQDLSILDFDERWTRHNGTKEQAIRAAFGMTAARYYQVLSRILDDPEMERTRPLLVHALRRRRADDRLERSSRLASARRPE